MPAPPPNNLPINNPNLRNNPDSSPSSGDLRAKGPSPTLPGQNALAGGLERKLSVKDVRGAEAPNQNFQSSLREERGGMASVPPSQGADRPFLERPAGETVESNSLREQSQRVMPEQYRGTKGARDWKADSSLPPLPEPPSKAGGRANPSLEQQPKKKIISGKMVVVLIILIIIGGGVFAYFNWFAGLETLPWEKSTELPEELPEAPPALPEEPGEIPSEPEPTTKEGIPPSDLDTDGDGLSDQEEEELGTNLEDADSDRDGIPDGWEVEAGLDPLDPSDNTQDPDADGLDNSNEYYYNSDPKNSDTDGDSYPDGMEVDNGYDPTKADAKLGAKSQEQLGVVTDAQNRDRTRKNDLKALELALELYYDDNGFFPESLASLTPDYVIRIPNDPLNPQYSYQYEMISPVSYALEAVIESEGDPDDLKDGSEDHLYQVRVRE